jgi:GAF domain-containing protein
MSDRAPEQDVTLTPQYQNYKRQKCFIAYSEQAPWAPDLLSACDEVLRRPGFDLELDHACQHFEPDITLREKALGLIANARYGIYDLSYWQDDKGNWQMPRNVFIELGMAIGLNRPMLLLRHTSNRELELPGCLQSLADHILEYGGDVSLKLRLAERLPQWVNSSPEKDWWNRYCVLGGCKCEYREAYPGIVPWDRRTLTCLLSHGLDADRLDFQCVIEDVLQRYDNIGFAELNRLLTPQGYDFVLCAYCQGVRSAPFSIHRLTPCTPAACFIAIGLSIAIEMQFEYRAPKILFAEKLADVPSLLAGYEVALARNNTERKAKLRAFMPLVMHQVSETAWKPKQLPFVETPPPSILGAPGAALNEAIWAITGKLTLEETLAEIVRRAQDLVGAHGHGDSSSLMLVTGDKLRPVAASGSQTLEVMMRKIGDLNLAATRPAGIIGRAALTGQLQNVEDVVFDADYIAFGEATRSELAVPIMIGGRVIGVINVESPIIAAFSDEDVRAIKSLADQGAVAIQNARRLEHAQIVAEISREVASTTTALYTVSLSADNGGNTQPLEG